MADKIIFHSPRIYYEVERTENAYSINVYLEGFEYSDKKDLHCRIDNFSESFTKATEFVKTISKACALPIHIPELAEEFLSL